MKDIDTPVPACLRKEEDGFYIHVVATIEGQQYLVRAPAGYVAQQVVKELRLPEKQDGARTDDLSFPRASVWAPETTV